jgi:type I restriction enzyme S subunit
MAERLTAAQRRYNENALLIAALGLIFKRLSISYASEQLGDLAETTSGGTPLRNISSYYEGDIPWIKSGELNDGIISEVEEYITKEGLDNSSAKVFPKGTVVVALYGATVGKTGILGLEAATNQAVCAIFPKSDIVSADFLFWFLRHKRPEFLGNSFGGAQPNISQKLLRITEIPIPHKNLQEAICDFLRVVERRQNGDKRIDYPTLPDGLADINYIVDRIEALAGRVAEARSLRQSAAEEGASLLNATLSKITQELLATHKPRLLEELTIFIGDMNHDMPKGQDEGIPFISPKDFTVNAQIDFERAKKITREDYKRLSKKACPQKGDILMARYGTIGAARFVETDREFLASYSIAVIRPDPKLVDGKFLYWMAISPYVQKQAIRGIRGSGMADLGLKTIRQFVIPQLNFDEQRQLVAYLDGLQAQVAKVRGLQEESARELEAMMPSILDRAFKGEL